MSVNQVALYVSNLHNHCYAPTTIVSYTSAIGYGHHISNVRDPTNSVLVQKILASTKVETDFWSEASYYIAYFTAINYRSRYNCTNT